jgi:hypothetical protein
MDEASGIRAYFSCPSCDTVDSATEKRKPNIIGRLQIVQKEGASVVGHQIQLPRMKGSALQRKGNYALNSHRGQHHEVHD